MLSKNLRISNSRSDDPLVLCEGEHEDVEIDVIQKGDSGKVVEIVVTEE